jgi:hypothetical protein
MTIKWNTPASTEKYYDTDYEEIFFIHGCVGICTEFLIQFLDTSVDIMVILSYSRIILGELNSLSSLYSYANEPYTNWCSFCCILIFIELLEYNHIQQIKMAANRTIKMGDENCRGN